MIPTWRIGLFILLFLLPLVDQTIADESNYLLNPQAVTTRDVATSHVDAPGMRNSQRYPLRTVASSLAIVLGTFLLLTIFFRKRGNKANIRFNTDRTAHHVMENLGELEVTPQVRLHLVRVGSRLLVLNLANGNVQTVAEINKPEEVEALLASSQSPTASRDTPPQVSELLRHLDSRAGT